MTNRNLNQYGAQTTGLGVKIARCSLDSQHGRLDRHPANVGSSFSRYTNNFSFRYTNDKQIDHSHQRPLRIKWTWEDNKLALYYYFRSNSAKSGYRKRMREIWSEFSRFKVTNQRFTDKVRKITKTGWFSDLDILEIHPQIYWKTHQQTPNSSRDNNNRKARDY